MTEAPPSLCHPDSLPPWGSSSMVSKIVVRRECKANHSFFQFVAYSVSGTDKKRIFF